MAITFPASPADGATYTNPTTGVQYIYNTADGVWKTYVWPTNTNYLQLTGGTLTGDLALGTNDLTAQDITSTTLTTTGAINPGANIIMASGNGIDFSATANSSGTMTSELLDDYEEGTWTPVNTGAGYTLVGASTKGFYTKIGNLVSIHFQVRFSAVGTNLASASFSGLPFASGSELHHAGVCRETTAYGDIFIAQVGAGNSTVAINSMDGVVNGDNAPFATGRNYNTQLTYFV